MMTHPVILVISILLLANTSLAQHDQCGKRIKSLPLMIGGQSAKRGMWPWQVGIYKRKASNLDFTCGGALIGEQWVLTAAHCFYVKRENIFKKWMEKDANPVNKYTVRAGDHDLTSYESTEQESIPQEIFVHPGYKPNRNHENDIALIKLSRKLILSNYVRTVCLPGMTQNLTKPGVFGTVAGWGETEFHRKSKILLYSTQSILNNDVCHRGSKYFWNETVTFCAHENKSMPCYGDSGSNMVRKVSVNGQLRWVTIGIVSWGGCSIDSKYGYYTRVQSFMDWIWHKTKSMCLDPGPPLNGLRAPAKRVYQHNDVVTFGCKANYSRIGKAVLSCKQDGTWNGYKPFCLVACSDPGVPTHGVRFGEDFQNGRIVTFSCNPGYKLTGNHYIICIQGKWNSRVPSCSVSCKNPGIPFHGRRLDHSFHHNDKVRFSCDAGWKVVGKNTITCKDGRWDHDTPKCALLEIDCRSLPTPLNGEKVEETKTTYQGRVTFQCKKKGYELQGSSTRVCQKDGKWDGALTTCARVECKDPGKPVNGGRNPDIDKYVYENKVTFACKKNHTLKGDAFIICEHDKTWTGTAPKCLVPCPDPGIPKGGSRHHHSFLHGDKVRFSCNKGWEMEGKREITCTDGTWDEDTPKCLDGCTTPRLPDHGGIHQKKNFYFHGERLLFYCPRNYKLLGDSSATCSYGRWNNDPPSCKRKCGYPGNPSNGWTNDREYFEGKIISFTCYRGYDLIGQQSIICLNTGQWSAAVPQCKPPCSDPGLITNGRQNGNDFSHGSLVRYHCFPGYLLEGSRSLRCIDGKWSQPTPTCKKHCTTPRLPDHGGIYSKQKTYNHGQQLRFYCHRNYKRVGPEYAACDNGNWNQNTPSCKRICTFQGYPTNGWRKGNEYFEDKIVSFGCNRGYDLIGQQSTKCLNTGQWSAAVPQCKQCASSLGMENRNIPDDYIKASSYKDLYHRPLYGRLNGPRAWCSGREYRLLYLEINLGKPYRITNLATQGSERDKNWVTQYIVAHTLARSSFISYREDGKEKVFKANKDETSVVWNQLKRPFIARKVRFYPFRWTGYLINRACMRVEIYGCDIPTDCVMVGSRVLGKWWTTYRGVGLFLRAYVKTIIGDIVELDLENGDHDDNLYKRVRKTSIVLDVPPKQNELQIGTKVLAPWADKYYEVTITDIRDRYYKVKENDGDGKWVFIDKLRLPKNILFCGSQ